MNGQEVVITAAYRTPIGAFGGAFKNLSAPELAVPLMKEIVDRAQLDPGLIDDVHWGCAYQRVKGETNLARVAAIRAGFPDTVPGVTMQRVCTAAMWAIVSGSQAPCNLAAQAGRSSQPILRLHPRQDWSGSLVAICLPAASALTASDQQCCFPWPCCGVFDTRLGIRYNQWSAVPVPSWHIGANLALKRPLRTSVVVY